MTMAKADYYEILGVSKAASEDELKRAYRKLAIQHHPDQNPGNKQSEETFKQVNEAYQILSDPQKRSAYDKFGHAGIGAAGGFEGGFSGSFTDIFDGIFGDIFGQTRGQSAGVDLRYFLEITFEEAAFGVEKKITFEKEASCDTCLGSGAKPGTRPEPCRQCRGTGQVRLNQGFFTLSRTCPECMGRGVQIADKCKDCRGRGRKKRAHSVSVKVPAGIDTDQRLRLRGEGEMADAGGEPGDLFVQIRVKEHPLFGREGEHVLLDLPITFVQAALGAEVELPTLAGKTTLKVAPGTQTGEIKKLKAKGIARLNGSGFGDQIVQILVETPQNLSAKQKSLLHQFDEENAKASQPGVLRFLEKVREILGK